MRATDSVHTLVPVPPERRPVRVRRAVRVLLRDPSGALLLFRDSDPGLDGRPAWWMTPGGGIDEGESVLQAGAREVLEETGLQLAEADFSAPLAARTVVHGYSDVVTVQREVFVRVDIARFAPVATGWTDVERASLLGHRWLAPGESDGLPVWPADPWHLADLPGESVLRLPLVEESTVPLRLGCAAPDVVAAACRELD